MADAAVQQPGFQHAKPRPFDRVTGFKIGEGKT
jgi:hypothetical protein